jgi:hypothetical protein
MDKHRHWRHAAGRRCYPFIMLEIGITISQGDHNLACGYPQCYEKKDAV